jgi:hypothetical protein
MRVLVRRRIGTLQGCRRLQLRLILPNKLLRRRSTRQRLFKATEPQQPPHTLVLWSTTRRKRRNLSFFVSADIEHCVKSTRRRWVQSRPDVPSIWPVKIGTNLSKKEILDLESAGFQLPQRIVISPRRLFNMDELPFDLSSYPTLASPNDYPKTRSGKIIHRNKNAPTTKHANNCASYLTLKGHLHKVTMILHLGFGCIVTLDSGAPPKFEQYLITIGSFPKCSCQYFKDMATKSLDKRGQWANCKHLYFVFTVIGRLDSNRDAFIHAPSFSFNEVKRILESGILTNRIP